jgi:hypothetical protein
MKSSDGTKPIVISILVVLFFVFFCGFDFFNCLGTRPSQRIRRAREELRAMFKLAEQKEKENDKSEDLEEGEEVDNEKKKSEDDVIQYKANDTVFFHSLSFIHLWLY